MLSLLLAPLLAAAPAHADWTTTGSKYDCTFSKSDEGAITALRAECSWSTPPEKLIAVLDDWGSHAAVFDSVSESTVLSGWSGGKAKVRQVHVASGISDREIVMDVTRTDIDGGRRWTHTKAADQSALSGQNIQVGRDDGTWEVRARDGGGSLLTYELRYDPAGSVPGFLVKAFQGAGFRDMMLQVRTAAGG